MREQQAGIIISFVFHFLFLSVLILSPYPKTKIGKSIKIVSIGNLSQKILIDEKNNALHEKTDHIDPYDKTEKLEAKKHIQHDIPSENKTKIKKKKKEKHSTIVKKTINKPEKKDILIQKSEIKKISDLRSVSNHSPDNYATPIASNEIASNYNPISGNKIFDSSNQATVEKASSNLDATYLNNSTILETEFGRADAPSFLKRVLPHYPLLARRLGKEGVVILKLFIDQKGVLKKVDVVRDPGHGLTVAAVDAVKKSEYLPAKYKGINVDSIALLRINFRLKDS